MREKPVNVLFTSVGRRVELLRAFKLAYQNLELEGRIIASDIEPLAPALLEADRSYIVPALSSPDYLPTLFEICRLERVDLVFPLIDPDIPILAECRSDLEALNTRAVVLSQEAVGKVADKWLTYQMFAELGVPTARTWLPDEVHFGNLEYPCFIKPRFGSAGKQVFKIVNERELTFFIDYVPEPVVMEYLSGPEITNDVVGDFDHNILAVVSRQRIEVRWGEVVKGKTMFDAEIFQHCLTIAGFLQTIGPITIQCILKEGEPHFTEVNPRFGGGVPLGIAAGVKSPEWLLALAAGRELKLPELGNYETGLYMTRFDDSAFMTQQDYDVIASRHL